MVCRAGVIFPFAFNGALVCFSPMSLPVDTIAALATPVGTSALAVLRASGPQAGAIATALCGAPPQPRTARHGNYRRATGQLVDDVVFTFFAGPHSYTGEDALEISCHGSPFIAQVILEDLYSRGCRPAEPGEFTKRAFLNGRMDLSQAEAVMDVIHARSERALAAANQQLRGALGRHVQELVDGLLGVLSHVEAYIDFPEEDLPAEDRQRLVAEIERLLAGSERLLATHHYGAQLRQGIKTVIIGEPNAGKSSVLNRLLGRERALVSAFPGTTRDYLEEPAILGSHFVRLVDTAAFNPQASDLERRGMDKTVEQCLLADMFLWVLDVAHPCLTLPLQVTERMAPKNTIVVINKIDLAPTGSFQPDTRFHFLRVSAANGAGFDELTRLITELADSSQETVGNDLIAVNSRHANALTESIESLRSALRILRNNEFSELLASELRSSVSSLASIVGRFDNERMLDRLFANFCIGK